MFPVPVALSTTVAPLTRFPKASLTVTVMVEALDPVLAGIEVGDRVTVEVVALGAAGVTVTVAVCVIATPLIVAETVLDCAAVELSAPVATPFTSVKPG